MGCKGNKTIAASFTIKQTMDTKGPFLMYLEQDLKIKVPEDIQSQPEFKALIDTLTLNRIRTKETLLKHIEQEMAHIDSWLKKNNSTGTDTIITMSNNIIKQERLKKWKEICEKYV